MGCCNLKRVLIVLIVFGLILIVLGAVLGFAVLPGVVENEISKQVRLEEGSEQFDKWKDLPFDLTFKVYLFNVENPDGIATRGETPVVKEKGPYIYRQSRNKTNIERDDENDTLSYYQYQFYTFDAEASFPLTEDDNITFVHVPLQGIFTTIEKLVNYTDSILINIIKPMILETFPDTTTGFHTVTVRQYLFGGYHFCQTGSELCDLITEVLRDKPIKTMEIQEDNSILFSFFRFKDAEHDGRYTITAGMDVLEDIGIIREWEGSATLDTWRPNSTCNEVKGRDSTIYPPFIKEEDYFDIFTTDICRVVTVHYEGEEEYEGITGQRRTLSKDTFNNDGDNSCYCIGESVNLNGTLDCFPNGFIDMYNCMGASVILSFPHFLHADEKYSNTVEGQSPNEAEHGTFLTLEPGTGFPLKAAKRAQFNMVIRPIDFFEMTKNYPRAMLPLLWIEESFELPKDLVQELKDRYFNKLILVEVATWLPIALGIVLFCGAGIWYFRR